MVQQDIAPAQGFKHGIGIVADVHLAGNEFGIFQVRPRGFIIELKQPLQIDDAGYAEHQRFVQIEGGDESIDNFRVRARFDFQAHRVALAALRDLRVDRFQQRARFFLFEIEIAVAGDAKGRGSQNLVAAIEFFGVRRKSCPAKKRSGCWLSPLGTRKSRGKRPRNGEHAEKGLLSAVARRRSKNAMHNALFNTCGKGCEGSTVTGVSMG